MSFRKTRFTKRHRTVNIPTKPTEPQHTDFKKQET
jgi:hypothetical protein